MDLKFSEPGFDSVEYWQGRAKVRQGIINHLSRKLKQAEQRIHELEEAQK